MWESQSSSLILSRLNADRAPQLKEVVMPCRIGIKVMNIEHIKLHMKDWNDTTRVHLSPQDQVSFLDLSHVLRIWVEMKMAIDEIATARG